MTRLTKSEWHQVERQYELDIDAELLSEIYSDLDEDEIQQMLDDLENGVVLPDDVVDAAYEANVDLDWEHIDDDWWTDRKGGYEVTYGVITD